jgi:Protein of unknown function (DUF2809)
MILRMNRLAGFDDAASLQSRSLGTSLVLMVITVVAGLAIRFAHLGLPHFVVKYGGSALWAVMIYWVCSSAFPSWLPLRSALISGTLGTAVEFLKLYNPPWLDMFRSSLAGIILLGRIFNVRDIVVYWIAISIAAGLDIALRRSRSARR